MLGMRVRRRTLLTDKSRNVCVILIMAIIASATAMTQGQPQTLVVAGHAGSVPVTRMNEGNYVEVEALARVVNGSLSLNGNQITLTLSAAGGNATASRETASGTATQFSKDFLRAGIEEMNTLREWRGALAIAITNQNPFTQKGMARYQALAITNLRLAQAAATTDADRKAAQFITNEYDKMTQLSDKYAKRRADTSYIAPDSLTIDPLDQNILACGNALGAMAASGQFTDDLTCH